MMNSNLKHTFTDTLLLYGFHLFIGSVVKGQMCPISKWEIKYNSVKHLVSRCEWTLLTNKSRTSLLRFSQYNLSVLNNFCKEGSFQVLFRSRCYIGLIDSVSREAYRRLQLKTKLSIFVHTFLILFSQLFTSTSL